MQPIGSNYSGIQNYNCQIKRVSQCTSFKGNSDAARKLADKVIDPLLAGSLDWHSNLNAVADELVATAKISDKDHLVYNNVYSVLTNYSQGNLPERIFKAAELLTK